MVGREVELASRVAREAPPGTDVALDVESLHVRGDVATRRCSGVSLAVRRGEIVGVAGVAGNGQRELAESITGMRAPEPPGPCTWTGRKLRAERPAYRRSRPELPTFPRTASARLSHPSQQHLGERRPQVVSRHHRFRVVRPSSGHRVHRPRRKS